MPYCEFIDELECPCLIRTRKGKKFCSEHSKLYDCIQITKNQNNQYECDCKKLYDIIKLEYNFDGSVKTWLHTKIFDKLYADYSSGVNKSCHENIITLIIKFANIYGCPCLSKK